MGIDIFRQPNTEERKNFINILDAQETILDKFKTLLRNEEKKYAKIRKPFCRRCAEFDFQDKLKRRISEFERTDGHADFTRLNAQLPKNLEEYSNNERFEYLKDQDAMEPSGKVESGGIQRKIKVGVHRDYICKERKCGISIFISNEDLALEKVEKNKTSKKAVSSSQ